MTAPTGKSLRLIRNVSSPSTKNILLPFYRKICLSPLIPPPQEGRIAIVMDVGSGMRWTRGCSARLRADEGIFSNGQAVWSCPPDAGVKSCGTLRKATVANKPGTPGRARSKPLKPLRRECRCSGGTCRCLRAQSAHSFARKARGCGQHPAFPAPSDFRGRTWQHHPGIRVAGM